VLEKYLDPEGDGVYVMASTIGSLEALLEYLREQKMKVSGVNIGKIHKKDVLRAQGQIEKNGLEEYATILAFDIKASLKVKEQAEKVGVRIFEAEIIYHLTDMFTKYMESIVRARK
jgi:translation initiation factor 5B